LHLVLVKEKMDENSRNVMLRFWLEWWVCWVVMRCSNLTCLPMLGSLHFIAFHWMITNHGQAQACLVLIPTLNLSLQDALVHRPSQPGVQQSSSKNSAMINPTSDSTPASGNTTALHPLSNNNDTCLLWHVSVISSKCCNSFSFETDHQSFFHKMTWSSVLVFSSPLWVGWVLSWGWCWAWQQKHFKWAKWCQWRHRQKVLVFKISSHKHVKSSHRGQPKQGVKWWLLSSSLGVALAAPISKCGFGMTLVVIFAKIVVLQGLHILCVDLVFHQPCNGHQPFHSGVMILIIVFVVFFGIQQQHFLSHSLHHRCPFGTNELTTALNWNPSLCVHSFLTMSW